jgi:hypothetical protein
LLLSLLLLLWHHLAYTTHVLLKIRRHFGLRCGSATLLQRGVPTWELVQPSDPTLSNARCPSIVRMRRFDDESVEVVEPILIVVSDGDNRNGIQVLTTGGEPYNGMQRAYGSLCYVHMGLGFVLRENLLLEILHSFVTPARCLSRGGKL